ncbi:hypothetical protein AB0873_11025 [Micromonospora sp. NPDC047707]|uniref:hypothetical protein n=1 Tax=Micromonospora sp. NPDC047707 TaxID=3154498 RepID=UPI003452CD07
MRLKILKVQLADSTARARLHPIILPRRYDNPAATSPDRAKGWQPVASSVIRPFNVEQETGQGWVDDASARHRG